MTDDRPASEPAEPAPDFGPSGYLPDRASRRARKIVLRAPMGLGWPAAALAAAVLVAVVGAVYLAVGNRAPGAPFVAVGDIAAIDPAGADVVTIDGRAALVVRAGGGVRAFADPPPGIGACADSRRLEDGERVWGLDGRALTAGTESLAPVTIVVFDGTVYVDVSTTRPPPRAAPDDAVRPLC